MSCSVTSGNGAPGSDLQSIVALRQTGLIWLLRGRPVIALTETDAAIRGATAVLVYRKLRKPALGPVGDSLDDVGAVNSISRRAARITQAEIQRA